MARRRSHGYPLTAFGTRVLIAFTLAGAVIGTIAGIAGGLGA